MHSFLWQGDAWCEVPGDDVPTVVAILHNGDYSGNIKFDVPAALANLERYKDYVSDEERLVVSIPFEAVKALVLNYVRDEFVGLIQDADDVTLQRLLKKVLNVHNE